MPVGWRGSDCVPCFPQSVCHTLWCTVGNTCHSKLDAAVDGTACGDSKVRGAAPPRPQRRPVLRTGLFRRPRHTGTGSARCRGARPSGKLEVPSGGETRSEFPWQGSTRLGLLICRTCPLRGHLSLRGDTGGPAAPTAAQRELHRARGAEGTSSL